MRLAEEKQRVRAQAESRRNITKHPAPTLFTNPRALACPVRAVNAETSAARKGARTNLPNHAAVVHNSRGVFATDVRRRLLSGALKRGEAPSHERLSWEDAVEEAGKWLGTLKLGRVLDGKTIDLTEAAKSLPFEGRFREMVFESARRKLKKRGARDVILPP